MGRFRYQLFLDAPETSPRLSAPHVWGDDGLPWRHPSVPDPIEATGTAGFGIGVSARRADGKHVIWGVSVGWLGETFHVDATVELEDPEVDGTEELHWHREAAADLDDLLRLLGEAISEVIGKRELVFA